jgi:cytochrome c oxidase accessory protein FixG
MTVLKPNDFIHGETEFAAPDVARETVEAVNRKATRNLYASRPSIHPKQAHGAFRRAKWAVMALTLGIYYALPWIRWNRGPDLPDQAVLLDLAHNRYFFFFLEIWPQEFYYVTGLLIAAGLGLFLFTAIAGRVWCGYTCPQTVWTDLMIAVERFWQGDRNQRLRLEKQPWGGEKLFKKGMTHLSWIAVGLATGGAFVFYFADAPTLAKQLATGTAPSQAYLFVGIFTLTTYVLGGLAREQVCIYMCPWPRIQGAMTDRHTLLIGYRPERGEPRGSHKKQDSWEGRGDCIDCNACVAVCPTGIDIRDGSQLECIQCALCIDACNEVMAKVGRPANLIAYDTVARQQAQAAGQHEPFRPVRPRTLLYAAVLGIVSAVMLVAWFHRTLLEINVLHDRNPPFVVLSDGGVRNAYTVKILNKRQEPRSFTLAADGLPDASIVVVGAQANEDGAIRVPTDDVREIRVLVSVSASEAAKIVASSSPFTMILSDTLSTATSRRLTQFHTPPRRQP